MLKKPVRYVCITCNLTRQKGKKMGMIAVNDAPAKNVWVYAFSEVLNCGNGAYSDENGYYTITDDYRWYWSIYNGLYSFCSTHCR